LGEIVWQDASTANAQSAKLARNGSPACSTLAATEASLLAEALLPEALLPEALLPEALLPEALLAEALLAEALLTKSLLAKATAAKTGVTKPATAELCVNGLVYSGTKCQCRCHRCSPQARASSKSHSVHSGWLESLSEYYGPARYRRAIDEPMVFVTILPTSLGLHL
jgi:hypothetical protein